MSAAHRGRGAIKCEDGTVTVFLRAQASSLPNHTCLSLRPPFRPPPRFLSRPVAVVELPVRLPARSLPPRNVSDALNLITQRSQDDVCATPPSPGPVLRSRRPQTRLDTFYTRTGRRRGCPSVDGPACEGLGRTARMHVPEESDSGIVPMSHSN